MASEPVTISHGDYPKLLFEDVHHFDCAGFGEHHGAKLEFRVDKASVVADEIALNFDHSVPISKKDCRLIMKSAGVFGSTDQTTYKISFQIIDLKLLGVQHLPGVSSIRLLSKIKPDERAVIASLNQSDELRFVSVAVIKSYPKATENQDEYLLLSAYMTLEDGETHRCDLVAVPAQ